MKLTLSALRGFLPEGDIRQERIEEIYKLLRGYAKAHANQLQAMGIEGEDFVQECVSAIFRRKGLDAYDPSKGLSFETLIFRIAKNMMIDIGRKANAVSRLDDRGRPIRPVSTETPLSKAGDKTLADTMKGAEKEGEDLALDDEGELGLSSAGDLSIEDGLAQSLGVDLSDEDGDEMAKRTVLGHLARMGIQNKEDLERVKTGLKPDKLRMLNRLLIELGIAL